MEVFIPIWTKTQTGPFLILVCSSISKQNSALDSGSGKGWLEYWNTWSLSLCVRPLHVHIFWLFPVSLQHRKDIPLGLDHTQSQHINVPCDFYIYPKDLTSNIQRICMNRHKVGHYIRKGQTSHCWNKVAFFDFCSTVQNFILPVGKLSQRRKGTTQLPFHLHVTPQE